MSRTYDFIIIGGGLGGLECAYILSKKGFSVCVLEKNRQTGGTLQNFSHDDCMFSTGMHYLGSLDEGQQLNRLFRYFGILDKLDLQRMDPEGFNRFSIGNREYAYPIGWDAFEKRMNEYFPSEKKAIREYIKLVDNVTDSQDLYRLRVPSGDATRANGFMNTGIYSAMCSITKNIELQNALCAMNFEYAGDKNTSSLYTHALINNYFIQSAYKMKSGSGQIAALLCENIKAAGGEIFTGQHAETMLIEKERLAGVKTTDDRVFRADRIISNVHPTLTMKMVEEGIGRKSFRNRLLQLPNTISVFTVQLKLRPGSFHPIDYNFFRFKHPGVWAVNDYDKGSWPGFYYLYTPAGSCIEYNCVSIYAYMRFDEVKQWSDMPSKERGPTYEAWKQKKSEQLILAASEDFPEIKDNIIKWVAASPLTYRDYIGTPGGGMYGTLRDYHNPMATYVSPRTKIPNLYFTGQNVNLHGMLGVSLSALMTCSEFISLNTMIKEINES